MNLKKIFNKNTVFGFAVIGSFILGAKSNEAKFYYYETFDLDGEPTTIQIPESTLYQKLIEEPYQYITKAIEDQFESHDPYRPTLNKIPNDSYRLDID